MEQGQENRSARERGRPFQFGLRTLHITVTVAALVCVVFFVLPDVISGGLLALMHALTATILVVAAVYGRGHLQAFCVGAMVPAAITFLLCVVHFFSRVLDSSRAPDVVGRILPWLASQALFFKLTLGFAWGMSLFCGLVSLLVARGLQRQRRWEPDDEPVDEPG